MIATLSKNEVAISNSIQSAGRFVLATNVLDESILSNSEMISEYKAQQSCERGFGFLKDPRWNLKIMGRLFVKDAGWLTS